MLSLFLRTKQLDNMGDSGLMSGVLTPKKSIYKVQFICEMFFFLFLCEYGSKRSHGANRFGGVARSR
jgi:hypothetical protein